MKSNNDDNAREVAVWERPEAHEIDFHGAAIIDERGREVPITEDMVQRAFEALGCPAEQPEPEAGEPVSQ